MDSFALVTDTETGDCWVTDDAEEATGPGLDIDDDPDLEALSDRQWAAWIAAHLARDGRWSDGRVLIRVDRRTVSGPITGDTWPGAPVQVTGVHADRGQSWRPTTTWAELRHWVQVADGEETAALDQLARERAEAEEQWGDLHEAMRRWRDAEQALADARQHRDDVICRYAADGATAYRLAQITGLSQQGVSKIVRGRNRPTGA